MTNPPRKALEEIQAHYRSQLREFGPTERGVGWSTGRASWIRHQALLETLPLHHQQGPTTIHEVGCGVGHLARMLRQRQLGYLYSGSDLLEEFLVEARRRNPEIPFRRFDLFSDPLPPRRWQYVLLSGSFNVLPPSLPEEEWEALCLECLPRLARMASEGLALNMLSRHAPHREEGMFYADPDRVLAAVQTWSPQASIRQDYDPTDFSIFVPKA